MVHDHLAGTCTPPHIRATNENCRMRHPQRLNWKSTVDAATSCVRLKRLGRTLVAHIPSLLLAEPFNHTVMFCCEVSYGIRSIRTRRGKIPSATPSCPSRSWQPLSRITPAVQYQGRNVRGRRGAACGRPAPQDAAARNARAVSGRSGHAPPARQRRVHHSPHQPRTRVQLLKSSQLPDSSNKLFLRTMVRSALVGQFMRSYSKASGLAQYSHRGTKNTTCRTTQRFYGLRQLAGVSVMMPPIKLPIIRS